MLGTSPGPLGGQCGCQPSSARAAREGISVAAASSGGCQSIKELEGLLKPDQSLPLPVSGWILGCIFKRVHHSSQRSSPGTRNLRGSLGRGGSRDSANQQRWLWPPLAAASRHRCAPGPGSL